MMNGKEVFWSIRFNFATKHRRVELPSPASHCPQLAGEHRDTPASLAPSYKLLSPCSDSSYFLSCCIQKTICRMPLNCPEPRAPTSHRDDAVLCARPILAATTTSTAARLAESPRVGLPCSLSSRSKCLSDAGAWPPCPSNLLVPAGLDHEVPEAHLTFGGSSSAGTSDEHPRSKRALNAAEHLHSKAFERSGIYLRPGREPISGFWVHRS